MLMTGKFIEHLYEGTFDYDRFCKETWAKVYACIRFPDEAGFPRYEPEDLAEEEMYPAIKAMFRRMGLDALDGKSGFVFVDTLGYVMCLAETDDDGKEFVTGSLAVDGILCIRPAEP